MTRERADALALAILMAVLIAGAWWISQRLGLA